uniref:Uncharacterized protein n=1 Tax=Avena sativa TaxID=4498 RepID=A0ACD5XQS9_AVESA
MDAQQGSGVTKDAAAAVPLNPLAKEFMPAVGAAIPALNTLAKEFVPAALNPLAKEFVPRSGGRRELSADALEFVVTPPAGIYLQAPTAVFYPADGFYDLGNAVPPRTWRTRGNNYSQHGKARFSQRVQRIHKKEFVRRTIYITNIDHTVTEEMLAELFGRCGIVVDCRLCGDPSSGFRFAFIEFPAEEDAANALHLDGAIVGLFPLKVEPSRTAIMSIKYSLLPQSEEEMEMSSRTVYCTNIENTITPLGLKHFCETYFGPVSRLRLLGHDSHATQIAFIEFVEATGAIIALSSSGLYADGLPIRVSPSKTPIRGGAYDRPPRSDNQPAGASLS